MKRISIIFMFFFPTLAVHIVFASLLAAASRNLNTSCINQPDVMVTTCILILSSRPSSAASHSKHIIPNCTPIPWHHQLRPKTPLNNISLIPLLKSTKQSNKMSNTIHSTNNTVPTSGTTTTSTSTGTGSGQAKQVASGIKGVFAKIHGAGEEIRGEFNGVVDELSHDVCFHLPPSSSSLS